MDPVNPKTTKNKKPYFAPTRKQPLVKKMIFDSHEAHVPSSCFELRPLHQNESNQQDIIFDSRSSSSLKQISQFDKNSPPEFYKIIYGHPEQVIQSQSMYIECGREVNSPDCSSKSQEGNESSSYVSYSLKRQNPISHEQAKNEETIAKIIQLNDKQINSHQNQSKKSQNNFQIKFDSIQDSKRDEKHKILKRKRPSNQRNQKQAEKIPRQQTQANHLVEDDLQKPFFQPENYALSCQKRSNQQIKDQIKIEEYHPMAESSSKSFTARSKIVRKKAQNLEFQLINQYMELASYASLVDQMILVYDKSPLFQFPLDFDSQTEESEEGQRILPQHKNQNEQIDSQFDIQFSNKIKLQPKELEDSQKSQSNPSLTQKYGKQIYNKIQKISIQQASNEKQRQKIIKQIHFERTKMYLNFYEPIQELKPYIKKMTAEEKKLFLAFKKELKEIKDIIDYFEKKNQGEKKDHVCKICGQEFDSGRQLGGHMSRKHPGKAIEYGFRRQLHKIKEIQRNRRKYFKELEDEEIIKMEQE